MQRYRMSRRAREACSVGLDLLHAVLSSESLCRIQQHPPSWLRGTCRPHLPFVDVLDPDKRRFAGVAPAGPNVSKLYPALNNALHQQTSGRVWVSWRSYQTVVSSLEKQPDLEGYQDEREEIKDAMREYLEQKLRVQQSLALEISQNSPVFLNGLVEKVKLEQKELSVDSCSALNVVAKEFLKRSKFKGVEPLLESLGLEAAEVAKVRNNARSGVNGVLVKVDLLKNVGVKSEEISRVFVTHPRFLTNASANQRENLEYLLGIGLSKQEMYKLITSYPTVLCFGLKDGHLALVKFLKEAGVQDKDMRKVLTRCPQLISLNVEKRLKPAIESLAEVGITGPYLTRVLVMQPSLLKRRLEQNIAFCREFGLDENRVIARLLVTCPNFSVDGCTRRLNFLYSKGLTKEQILIMINKNAAFLSLSVETALAPKLDYLVNVMGRSVEELVKSVNFLTMSLEHRIKPRHEVLAALKEAGKLQRSYSLTTMVGWSDARFFKLFVENNSDKIKQIWASSSSPGAPTARTEMAPPTAV